MRRLIAVVVVALCLTAATSAAAAVGAPDPLQAQEWWLSALGADRVTPPGPGVPITIVDSGVDATQPEFARRPNTTYLNAQTVVGRSEFHGTFVASVAAAPANGVGMVGVYPGAALQVFDASPDPRGVQDPVAIAGIRTAAAHCPGVINLSFGGAPGDPRLQDAILTAVANGCLVVAAAGNDGETGSPETFPAAWPHVFTVGATDENDAVAPFSTRGPFVDVAAPGDGITGAVPLWADPSGYTQGSGTSFSAPMVAAAAAWVWTVRPTLSASQLAGVLRSSARDIGPPGFDAASGWGILDIPAALTAPAPPSDPFEPNDDVAEVKPGRLLAAGSPPLTSPAKPSVRIAGTLSAAEDPRDLYRIWVPAHRTVRVSVSRSDQAAAARIWGPRTISVDEGVKARRRDLRGTRASAGKKGFAAYVEVLLTGRADDAAYVLGVTAARR